MALTPPRIRMHLAERDTSQQELAEELGVSQALVSMVIHGARPNRQVRRLIAQRIQLPFREVWGVEDADDDDVMSTPHP